MRMSSVLNLDTFEPNQLLHLHSLGKEVDVYGWIMCDV